MHDGTVGDCGHSRWHEENVDGEVYDDWSGYAGVGGAEGICDNARDLLDVSDAVSEFRYGLGEDDLVVEALQGVGLGITERRRRLVGYQHLAHP